MIASHAFLAIEKALASKLGESFSKATKDLGEVIQQHLDAGEYEQAEAAVAKISLLPIYEEHVDFVKYMTNMAMLFGASRVTPKPGTSTVGLGYEGLMVQQAVVSFASQILMGEQHLKDSAMQLIAQYRSEHVQKAERRILQPFQSFLDSQGNVIFNIAAALHTSRVSAYGFTAEAEAMGYEYYQINEQLDTRTCPVCQMMHGKTFKVSDARGLLNVALRVSDPTDLKQLQPWPKQDKESIEAMSKLETRELVEHGWHIPPFHPGCRGLLARVGKLPTTVPVTGTVPDLYTASKQDFSALGITITDQNLSEWNNLVGLSPAEVLGRLQGSTSDVIMQQAFETGEAPGLLRLDFLDGPRFALRAPMFGEAPVAASVSIPKDGASVTIHKLVPSDPATKLSVMKKYLLSTVSLARDMGKATVVMSAGSEWVKYGFVPVLSEWGALVDRVAKRYAALDKALISPATKQTVAQVLSSNDPLDLSLLTGLKEKVGSVTIGQALLDGLAWDGELRLNSPEAMASFMSHFKANKG